jgi:hypothetical protein
MFEMKNESNTTVTKNKDFYKELNKERNKKPRECAALVSLLYIERR